MNKNETIIVIVFLLAITIIIILAILVHFAENVVNKDIEVGTKIAVNLTEGSVESTLTFGCTTVANQNLVQLDIPKKERKKRNIRRQAPSYIQNNTHN
ncbi:MAG: hypothetical protein ACI9Y7_001655 [Dokdonia sp.]|jgi:hypothetical protein